MTAVPVKVLVMEAIRERVVASGARRDFTAAKQMPADQTSASRCTTPTAAPGSRCSFTNEAAFASSLVSMPAPSQLTSTTILQVDYTTGGGHGCGKSSRRDMGRRPDERQGPRQG